MKSREDWSKAGATIEIHPDPEQYLRCPGYFITPKAQGYEYMVLCVDPHPHRMMVKVHEDGTREEIREYGPKSFDSGLVTEMELDRLLANKARRLNRDGASKEHHKDLAAENIQRLRLNIAEGSIDARQIQQAIQNPTPNIPIVRLPDAERLTDCRCGRKLVPVDWSMQGVENPPPICPLCRDLPAQCACDEGLF